MTTARDRGLHGSLRLHSPAGSNLFCSSVTVCNNQSLVPRVSAPLYPQIYRDMVGIPRAPRPRTPVRRLSRLLNSLSRPNNHPRTASRFIQGVRSTNHTGEVFVAIQNEDPTEDAVVVTSLEKIPFCCHADLLLMNREQLLTAASVLNERLPAALRIDVDRSDSYIRNSIEFIVGLRNDPPDAPMKPATPSRNFIPSSPISPLAKRGRSQRSQLVASPSPLGDVTEEEESEGPPVVTPCKRPPLKRRKLVQGSASPTPPRAHPRPSTLQNLGSTPTQCITRSQSTHTTRPRQTLPDRVLRSHSQKVNPKGFTVVSHLSSASLYTPNSRVRSSREQQSSGGIPTSPSYPLTESSASDTPSPTPRIPRRKCRRDSSVEREVGVVMGLGRMNLPPVDSDD